MLKRKSLSNKIDKIILLFAIILLAGVIAMIIGFANNNSFIIYFGVLLTASASFLILFKTIIPNGSKNIFYHIHRER